MITKSTRDTTAARPDRRVRKTRRKLRDTLVTLVLERGWDAVSVKDVCEGADVGRSTFYVHFVDKEDLLLSAFEELHQVLAEPTADPRPFSFAEPLVLHARDNVRLYRTLIGRKSGQAVQRRFRDVVRRVVGREVEALGVPPERRALATQFISGGFVELLLAWLDRSPRLDGDLLASTFRTFALGVVRAR